MTRYGCRTVGSPLRWSVSMPSPSSISPVMSSLSMPVIARSADSASLIGAHAGAAPPRSTTFQSLPSTCTSASAWKSALVVAPRQIQWSRQTPPRSESNAGMQPSASVIFHAGLAALSPAAAARACQNASIAAWSCAASGLGAVAIAGPTQRARTRGNTRLRGLKFMSERDACERSAVKRAACRMANARCAYPDTPRALGASGPTARNGRKQGSECTFWSRLSAQSSLAVISESENRGQSALLESIKCAIFVGCHIRCGLPGKVHSEVSSRRPRLLTGQTKVRNLAGSCPAEVGGGAMRLHVHLSRIECLQEPAR